MEKYRPDPDALLAAIKKGEARDKRGKLKLFLGMAPGVGKTYAMLDAARQLVASGADVIVGYVETHQREETEALLETLEVTPRRRIDYRGVTLEEMDLDAILKRKPQLVLVDELAHTNAPTVRHLKRYQDVMELLEAGIDVFSTVNIQHIVSRTDIVQQITGVSVHETVPDSILDLANDIELIDLPPEELQKRLVEGKVYTPERVDVALNNFFRTGNLTALREMALRLTAEHVDHKLSDYMQVKQISGPWKSGDRLMVAVSPSPFSEKLIRWTRRMAYSLEAPWLAVYVERSEQLSSEDKTRLAKNLSLARDLGAEVITSAGDNIEETLIRVAHQYNVTQITVGKHQYSQLPGFLKVMSPVDRIIRVSGDIDIFVVTGDETSRVEKQQQLFLNLSFHSDWKHYAWTLLIVFGVTTIDSILFSSFPWIGYQAVGLTELLAVLLIAVYIGRGPALLAAAVGAISWDYLFIEPRFTFAISQIDDMILFILYFVIAILIGNLAARVRTQERQVQYNADRAMALYTLAHETATAMNMDDVLQTGVSQVGRVFNAEVAIILSRSGKLENNSHHCSTLQIDEKEYSVAAWVFENGKPAGRFTDTLPSATARFLPLRTSDRIVGVIGIKPRLDERLSFDQEILLETFSNQLALVIERELLDEAAEQASMMKESERLYTTLLNSISHELRTPIATITGAASSLNVPNSRTSQEDQNELIQDIQDAANRLNQLVGNLLDMSRLESGRLKLKLDWCDVGDVIAVAVGRMGKSLADRSVIIHYSSELPLVKMDFVLMEQVLVDILDNACNYTPKGSPIEIAADLERDRLILTVSDSGPGIPEEELGLIFEKFHRVPGTISFGTGLGLSICRGLVEAHGGILTAKNRSGGGVCFTISLPASASPPPVKEALT